MNSLNSFNTSTNNNTNSPNHLENQSNRVKGDNVCGEIKCNKLPIYQTKVRQNVPDGKCIYFTGKLMNKSTSKNSST